MSAARTSKSVPIGSGYFHIMEYTGTLEALPTLIGKLSASTRFGTTSGGATLTVKNSSANGGVFKHTATSVEKSAILASGSDTVVNIESGTIESEKGNALKVDGAAFHVSGGTITGGNNGIYVATHSASPVCTVSGGKIGPITQKLYDELTGIQWGRVADPHNWITKL